MVGERGSPSTERAPSARGPNSMRPCIQPTASPAASALAVCSITSSSDTTVKRAPAAASRRSTSGCAKAGPSKAPCIRSRPPFGLTRAAEKLVPYRQRRPDGAAGVARRRLHPDALEGAVAQDLAVGHAVERDAAGETEIVEPVLAGERARQPQHDLLGHLLDRGGDVHVERREQILGRVAHRRAEQVGELPVGHGEAGAIIEIIEIEPERSVRLQVDQMIEDAGGIFRLAVGGEAHELVLAGIHLEAGVVGERRIEQPERMREVQLLDDRQLVAVPDRRGGGAPFADPVHGQHRARPGTARRRRRSPRGSDGAR